MSPSTNISIVNSFKEEAREKGVSHVTISNVADRCGCARQTVYYHFCGTMDLVKWIIQNENSEMIYDTLDRNRWKNDLYRLLNTLKSNDWLFSDLYHSKYWEEFNEFLMECIREKVVDTFFYNRNSFGTAKSRNNLARMITYSIMGQITDWIKEGFVDSPYEMMQDFDRLCGSAMHRLIEDFLVFRPQEIPVGIH